MEPRNWRKCSLFDVNFRPLNMSPERLERKYHVLVTELYRPEAVESRHKHFMRTIRHRSSEEIPKGRSERKSRNWSGRTILHEV